MNELVKFQDLKTDLDLEAFRKLQEEMQTNAVAVLSSKFKDAFDKHPELEAVVWAQYAPYFNDGEPCVFNVHELCFKLNEEGQIAMGSALSEVVEFDIDNIDYWESDISRLSNSQPISITQGDLNEFAQTFESLFEAAFGADSAICVTREGFHISEYEHD